MSKSYRLDPSFAARVQWVMLAPFAVALCLILFFGSQPQLVVAYTGIACLGIIALWVALMAGWYIARFIRDVRLETTPDGIEYRYPGFSLRAPWNRVQRIEKGRFFLSAVENLRVKAPAIKTSGPAAFIARWSPVQPVIPLGAFLPNWRHLEMGQTLSLFLEVGTSAPSQVEQRTRDEREARVNRVQAQMAKLQRLFMIGFGIVLVILFLWSFISAGR